MQITGQPELPMQTFIPHNSADWHFLLPVSPDTKILVVGRDCDDYIQYFNKLGIESIAWDCAIPDLASMAFPLAQFDIIAIPHGFLDNKLAKNPLYSHEIFRDMRRLLKPGGSILIGFVNIWALRRKFSPDGFFSTPRKISRLLKESGYELVRFYGAISNLSTPDYIFPLTWQTVGFVLEHGYRNKLPHRLIPWLHNPLFAFVFSHLLPTYFAIAIAPGDQ